MFIITMKKGAIFCHVQLINCCCSLYKCNHCWLHCELPGSISNRMLVAKMRLLRAFEELSFKLIEVFPFFSLLLTSVHK